MAHHDSGEQIVEAATRGGRLLALAPALFLTFALVVALYNSLLHALAFAGFLFVFALPGVPFARRRFDGPERWLVGGALGYFASSLAASVLVRLGYFGPVSVLSSSALLFLVARSLWRWRHPGEGREPPPGAAWLWLSVCWLLVIGMVALPFLHVASSVPGGLGFRAYFSADLMTHLSVVAELQKGVFPPVNPFYAGDPLDYYWLYFTFPAAVGAWTGNQGALLSLNLASGLLFSGLLFTAMRRLGLTSARACLATGAGLFAASYDGALAVLTGERWTEMNVDAFSRWVLELVSLDGLHRSILYTPQHLFSYSLLLILLVLTIDRGPRGFWGAAFAGVLLGGMAGTSVVTAMLAGPWLVLLFFWRRPSLVEFLTRAAVATFVSLAFLGWYFALGFFGSAGGALTLRTPRLLELPALVLIETGALVAMIGVSCVRSKWASPDKKFLALAALALAAVLFLDLTGYEGVWMAWRAGSVLLVSCALLAAPAFRNALGLRHVIVLAPALLTVVLDVGNAQDTSNRGVSPGGFRWTTVVSEDETEALRWLRRETPLDAIVQWDVRARDPGAWALVPALAERRMAVGFPIFLLDVAKYRVRERRHVRPIFTSGDARDAHRRARTMGIQYLILGASELEERGERVRVLFEAPELFRPVFENESVTILAVIPG